MQLGISLCLCSAISVHSKNEYLNEEKLRAISANSVVSLPSFCLRLHGRERNKICGSSRKEDEKRRRRKKEEEEVVVVVVGRVNLEQGRGGRRGGGRDGTFSTQWPLPSFSRGRRNKNRLSSTCGEELQKIFKDRQS